MDAGLFRWTGDVTRIYSALFTLYCRAASLRWDRKHQQWLHDDGHGGWSEAIPESIVLLGFWFFVIGIPVCIWAAATIVNCLL